MVLTWPFAATCLSSLHRFSGGAQPRVSPGKFQGKKKFSIDQDDRRPTHKQIIKNTERTPDAEVSAEIATLATT